MTLTVVAGLAYFYWAVDDEIRANVERRFAQHYTGLDVTVRAAQRIDGQGILIYGITLRDPQAPAEHAVLVHIDEIFLTCSTAPRDLLQGEVNVRHMTIRRPTLHAVRATDGSWNLQQLLPLPKFGDSSPTSRIESARLEIVDVGTSPPTHWTLRDVGLSLTPRPAIGLGNAPPAPAPGATPTPAGSGTGAPSIPPASAQGLPVASTAARQPATVGERAIIDVEARLSGDHFQQVLARGWADLNTGAWSVRGRAEAVALQPELWRALPAELAEKVAGLQLTGRAQFEFTAQHAPGKTPGIRYEVAGQLTESRLTDRRLALPLTELSAGVYLNNAGLRIQQLSARYGDAQLRLNIDRQGFAANSPVQIRGNVQQLRLEPSLVQALSPEIIAVWSKFQPSGTVDVAFDVRREEEAWFPQVEVACRDVAFEHASFPYRLQGGVGLLRYDGQQLALNVTALAGDTPVLVNGLIESPGPDWTGSVDLVAEEPVLIDQKLSDALRIRDLKVHDILAAMHIDGQFTFRGRFGRRDPRQEKLDSQLTIGLTGCSMRYEKFPYPLQNIRGTVELAHGQWAFRNFEGFNDTGMVTCTGSLLPVEEGTELSLDLVGSDIALEDELRSALSPKAQQVWLDMRPRGSIDHLKIAVRFLSANKQLTVDVQAQKWPASQTVESRSISLFPRWFSYALEHVSGSVHYRDGYIELKNMRADHGRTAIALSGFCDVAPGAGWRVRLDNVVADRVAADRDLINALPPQLASAVAKLNIDGPISLRGNVQLMGGQRDAPGVSSAWDLAFDLENGGLTAGVPLEHVHGGVRLFGTADATHLACRGELQVDSLVYRGMQFTEVTGPLWLDRSRILLGAWAERREPGKPARQLSARLYGGNVLGDLQVLLEPEPRFTLQASLADADLARVARETTRRPTEITGTANGYLRLAGLANGIHTFRGDGAVRLRNADIYELPQMISLLKLLSIRPPGKTAFTDSDIDFRVEGDHLYLSRIDFHGDAISLRGNGEMNLDRQIAMNFYTMVGRDEFSIPVLRPLLGEASRQILMIKVAGSLDQPQMTRHVLPGINDTLRQLFPEEPVTPEVGRLPFMSGSTMWGSAVPEASRTPTQLAR